MDIDKIVDCIIKTNNKGEGMVLWLKGDTGIWEKYDRPRRTDFSDELKKRNITLHDWASVGDWASVV